MDRSGIRFGNEGLEFDPGRVEVKIPRGLTTKSELFAVLDQGLRLPRYFGMNWDALDECIRDLSWLPPGQVVLVHSDVPLANDRKDQNTYISIITDAVARWMNAPDRDLLITFPSEYRKDVEQLR